MDILAQMGLRELVPYTMRLTADSLCDLNRRLDEQQPKPQLSYIGLIAMAILSSREKKMILSEVYQWITDNYPYFRSRGPGWRNSIRHNLSLNDCFIKAGRSANGKVFRPPHSLPVTFMFCFLFNRRNFAIISFLSLAL